MYPTFLADYVAPHFKSSLRLIILEWKDKANNNYFFKSSLISWITKQCLELSVEKFNLLTSYYSCSLNSFFILDLLMSSSILEADFENVSTYYSAWSLMSRVFFPVQRTINSLLLIEPYFLANFISMTPILSPWEPSDMSTNMALDGSSSTVFTPRVIPDMRCLMM